MRMCHNCAKSIKLKRIAAKLRFKEAEARVTRDLCKAKETKPGLGLVLELAGFNPEV